MTTSSFYPHTPHTYFPLGLQPSCLWPFKARAGSPSPFRAINGHIKWPRACLLVSGQREACEGRRAGGGLAVDSQQPPWTFGACSPAIETPNSCPIKPLARDRARQRLAPGQGGVTRQDQPCNTSRLPGRGRGRPGVGLAATPGHQTCCVTLDQPPTLSGPGFTPVASCLYTTHFFGAW